MKKNRLINEANSTNSTTYSYRTDIEYVYGTIKGDKLNVTSTYKPHPYFYVKFEKYVGSVSPNRIVNIMNANIHREYNGISKQFSGSLYYNLVAGNEIYWDVNGDFYNNGTTSYSGGVSIGIKEVATVDFSVSSAKDHFKYIHQEGRYRSSGLSQ